MPILSKDEIIKVTGKKQNHAQRKVLVELNLVYMVRGDGSNVVSRAHFEKTMGGSITESKKTLKTNKPNFDAIK